MDPKHYKDFFEVYVLEPFEDPDTEFANRTGLDWPTAKKQGRKLRYEAYISLCVSFESDFTIKVPTDPTLPPMPPENYEAFVETYLLSDRDLPTWAWEVFAKKTGLDPITAQHQANATSLDAYRKLSKIYL